jgi:phosphate starvation-inducible PhoH-like protein
LIEKHIVLEDIDPVVFYGVNNAHLQMLKALFPKLRIVARDNVVRVLGDEEDMARFEEDIEKMRKHVVKYNSITDEDILDIIKGRQTKADAVKDVLVYSISGRPIKSRSENQQRLIDAFNKNDMIFAVGPAGTGKTYLSIALAVKALKEKTAKRIILSRPAVEAGEKLGFLPGDMKDKIDPYLQPLYDALQDMLPATRLNDLMEKHIIQIAPLAFMRGRTLSDAIVILDEAQNTTTAQIRMFLTRMGWNTKMIITGDMTQIDLPREQKSGLKEALRILKGVEGISVIELTKKDIVRHQLVTRIVNAYEAYDKHQEEERRKRTERMKNNELDNRDAEKTMTIIDTGDYTEN